MRYNIGTMSKRFQLNKEDLWKIAQVVLWSGLSAGIVSLIGLLEALEVPVQYTFLVPLVNTVLYAALKFVNGKK